jgi:uncharacterized membrane protein YkoI
MKKIIYFLILLFLCLHTPPSFADESEKPSAAEVARAVKNGVILPLSVIEQRLEGKITGKIINIEIERDDDEWVYEFKIITPSGRRKDIYVDAKTGLILREKVK